MRARCLQSNSPKRRLEQRSSACTATALKRPRLSESSGVEPASKWQVHGPSHEFSAFLNVLLCHARAQKLSFYQLLGIGQHQARSRKPSRHRRSRILSFSQCFALRFRSREKLSFYHCFAPAPSPARPCYPAPYQRLIHRSSHRWRLYCTTLSTASEC